MSEKFQDTKGVISDHRTRRDRQCNDHLVKIAKGHEFHLKTGVLRKSRQFLLQ